MPALRSIIWDNLLMQGFERMDRELLDAAALGGQLVPAGCRAVRAQVTSAQAPSLRASPRPFRLRRFNAAVRRLSQA